MSNVHKRTFSLTKQQSEYVDSVVSAGGYASGSEVIREGIRMLQEREQRFEKWLKDEAGPTYDEWRANPDDLLTADQVFGQLEAETEEDPVKKVS